MATVTMRQVRPGEVPPDGGTAVQDDPGRPVFTGNGPDDFVCVRCGNVLAHAMDAEYMTYKVRVRCGRCSTVNVHGERPAEDPRRKRLGQSRSG
jgi:ribosomal protein S27AE